MQSPQLEVWVHDRPLRDPSLFQDPPALSPRDRERLDALKPAEARRDFLSSRVRLPALLAQSRIAPFPPTLELEEAGRPVFAADRRAGLSWSRSEGALALAVVRQGEVGVDIERVRPIAFEAMLPMLCTARDMAAFDAAALPDRVLAFFRLWTAKEAILKCLGTGFQGIAKTIHVPPGAYASQGATNHAITYGTHELRLDVGGNHATVVALAQMA